jgi:type IV secretory pathway VirB10-like protein
MRNDEANKDLNVVDGNSQPPVTNLAHEEPDAEEAAKGGWRETFRTAFDRARRQQRPAESRQELSRDKSKSLMVLAGVAVALLLAFFGLFSSPKKRISLPGETPRGQASLGRNITPGQENNDLGKTVVPMLSADVRSSDPALAGQVTPEDVGRTSRTGYATPPTSINPAAGKTNPPPDYALSRVDFSDPLVGQGNTIPAPPPAPGAEPLSAANQAADLKKPSLVFVRSQEAKAAIQARPLETQEETLALPVGTRLVARLEAPVSSAVAAPVVAVVEYNYERNGQIVLPAGAKVFGRLSQVNPSGYVGIQFSRVEMPDGTAAKVEASAMDLSFGPLKGNVSGKKTGTKFLVRSLTGLGTVASYLVGPQGSSSAGLISTNALMRERLADNVATAGQEQLNGLAFNQNLVVTVPGNTRFYIVLQKPTADYVGPASGTRNASSTAAGFTAGVPSLEELRQLMQLRGEINELYTQNSGPAARQPQP